MIVREIKSPEERKELNIIAKEYGTVFHWPEWISIFGDSLKIHGIFSEKGALVGGFYGYEKKFFGISVLRNPELTPDIGPFLRIEAKKPVSIMDRLKETLAGMAGYLKRSNYDVISLCLNKSITDTQPFIWSKFKVVPGYTYIIELSKSTDILYENMSSTRRHNINKAIRDKIRLEFGADRALIKNLVLKTFSRQKMKVNEHLIEKILFEFANETNSYSFTAFNSAERPISCCFCVYDNKVAYYLLGGYDTSEKHEGAGAYTLWEAICHAKKLGLKYFDFEGSMVPQIERFFRGFGGTLIPYFTINRARLPIEVILKFIRRERF